MGEPHVQGGARLVLCADTSTGLDRLVATMKGGRWPVVPIAWPDVEALRATAASAYVVQSVEGHERDVLCRALAARDPAIPLVVVGGDPLRAARPTLWLADAAAAKLASVLDPLIPRTVERPAAAWRRKGDMIIGASATTRQLLRALDQLAPAQTPVLITGESGVGKELVAQALHYTGPRAKAPFIAINCAAIPENLFEAELFGYQRGAFTGAVNAHDGAFAAAEHGTLFLDEIAEMSLGLQAKLLRVLETGEVQRIGSTDRRKVTVRLVTATNRDLASEIAAGRFREDLFYRIHVVPVHIAPLRDRLEDIPAIANHHLALIAERERRTAPRLTARAIDKLLTHAWPGNVRELVNVLERAVLGAGSSTIDAEHLMLPEPSAPRVGGGTLLPYREAKHQFELDYYTRLVKAACGNISLAAKLGQKTRKEIYDALKRLHIDTREFRSGS